MIRFNRLFLRSILITIFVLLLSGIMVFSFQTVAYSANPFSDVIRRIQLLITPPPQTTPTGRARGGAGRGPVCSAIDRSVTALAPVESGTLTQDSNSPSSSIALEYVWGATVEANPILWFYIPYAAPEDLQSAEFMLLDEREQPVLNQPLTLELSGTPGIISIRLPYTLDTHKSYNWYLSIICDPQKPSRNPGVHGWLQRIESSSELARDLNASEPQNQYMAYAQHGIWYEMVTALAKNHQTYPDNTEIQRDWVELLTYLELQDIIEAPIVNCCSSDAR